MRYSPPMQPIRLDLAGDPRVDRVVIGRTIRSLRLERGMMLKQVSDPSAVAHFESGAKEPRLSTVGRLLSRLGYTLWIAPSDWEPPHS